MTQNTHTHKEEKKQLIDDTRHAISRSKEILDRAEQALIRTNAVVEISNNFLTRLPKYVVGQ